MAWNMLQVVYVGGGRVREAQLSGDSCWVFWRKFGIGGQGRESGKGGRGRVGKTLNPLHRGHLSLGTWIILKSMATPKQSSLMGVYPPFSFTYILFQHWFVPMSRKNRWLIADELIESEE